MKLQGCPLKFRTKFPAKGSVIWCFVFLFVVSLNKLLKKIKLPVDWYAMTMRWRCYNVCRFFLSNKTLCLDDITIKAQFTVPELCKKKRAIFRYELSLVSLDIHKQNGDRISNGSHCFVCIFQRIWQRNSLHVCNHRPVSNSATDDREPINDIIAIAADVSLA